MSQTVYMEGCEVREVAEYTRGKLEINGDKSKEQTSVVSSHSLNIWDNGSCVGGVGNEARLLEGHEGGVLYREAGNPPLRPLRGASRSRPAEAHSLATR